MNAVHLHLLLNHVPVIGTVITILLLAFAVWRGNPQLIRVSFGMFVILAVMGTLAYLTGEPAEELAESLPGVSESVIEPHEEAALLATIALGAVGGAALAGLIAFRGAASAIPMGFARLVLVFALVPAAAMGYTANLGGQIRHTEIRSATAPKLELLPTDEGEIEGVETRAPAVAPPLSPASLEVDEEGRSVD